MAKAVKLGPPFIQPARHSSKCRRPLEGAAYGLDPENCLRCRKVVEKIERFREIVQHG